ncbi:hypothetical protein [Synechococcus sp. PCC 7336]|uniref:spermine/spermidine synthase domain-containing protein n=1 Tax=Synechococcus sp. PCC 7336 TaxID=195250 RepID=UPI000346B06B|nr:hypothetical protein [Synechococcus sp. PCC 7336]
MSVKLAPATFWLNDIANEWEVHLHGIKRLLLHRTTAVQDLQIVEHGTYGKTLILDGKLQSTAADEFIYHETLVHPAAVACQTLRNVLILGGGEGATVREVLRWQSVERVAMVDIDGEVVDACRTYLPEMHANAWDDPRVEVIIGDALQYVATTDERWDLIVDDLSEPVESGPAVKLFVREFYAQVQAILAPDGVFAMQAGSASPVQIELFARTLATLRSVFPYTQTAIAYIPSFTVPWGFVLASAKPFDSRPDPAAIDRLLAQNSHGGFRLMDGETLLGTLQVPKYLRAAIAAENRPFTLADIDDLSTTL